jgi:hypothetical protein
LKHPDKIIDVKHYMKYQQHTPSASIDIADSLSQQCIISDISQCSTGETETERERERDNRIETGGIVGRIEDNKDKRHYK